MKVLQQGLLSPQETYRDYTEYYTDGSKSSSVGCAVYSGSFTKPVKLRYAASIFTTELYGILLAVEQILPKCVTGCSLPAKNLLTQHVQG